MAVYVSHLAEPGTKAWPVFVPVWCELLLRMAKRHRKTSRTRYSGKSHEKQGNNRRAKRKGSMAKARSTTTGASVRARATSKSRSAKAPARPVSKSAVKPRKRHHLLGFLAAIFALLALAGTAARALPADLQELPFVPIVVSDALVHVAWFGRLAVGHRVTTYPCRIDCRCRNRMQWLLTISVLLLDRSASPSRAERRGRSLPQHQRHLCARHDLQRI